MIKTGDVLKNKNTSKHYVVSSNLGSVIKVIGYDGEEASIPVASLDSFEIFDGISDVLPTRLTTPSALDKQHGGDHNYQPWQVLKAWLSEEEFRGYMKGTAIEYLAREGDLDVKKATHTLQAFLEMGVTK